MVAPSRGRGLKLLNYIFGPSRRSRPFTGAWIETAPSASPATYHHVAPSRGRGLKRELEKWVVTYTGRPFTGAWIETDSPSGSALPAPCRPFTGAWIETSESELESASSVVAPSRGRGLKPKTLTPKTPTPVAPSRGRGLKRYKETDLNRWSASPLHGGVD